jgi:hypothetical protein
MASDVLLSCVIAVAAGLLWTTVAIFDRRLPNPAWILVILLFVHDIARVVGRNESLLNTSIIGPGLIICFIALPVVLRSPQKLLDASREPAIWIWSAFLSYAALSLLWSGNREYGLDKVYSTIGLGLLPGLAMFVMYRYSRRLSWNALLLLGAFFSVAALVQGETATGRLTTEGGNPIWLARAALLLVTIAVWDSHSRLSLRITTGVLGVWVAIATQSRGPLLAWIAAPLVVAGIAMAKNKHLRYRRTSVAMVAFGVATLAVLIVISPSTTSSSGVGGSRLVSLVHIRELGHDNNVLERLTLQRAAFTRFLESPVVGMGIGANAPPGQRLYPHNVPLEIASELGLVGLALWVGGIACGIVASRRDRVLLLLLLQALFYCLTSGDLGANTLVVVFSVFACAINGECLVRAARPRGEVVGRPSSQAHTLGPNSATV